MKSDNPNLCLVVLKLVLLSMVSVDCAPAKYQSILSSGLYPASLNITDTYFPSNPYAGRNKLDYYGKTI